MVSQVDLLASFVSYQFFYGSFHQIIVQKMKKIIYLSCIAIVVLISFWSCKMTKTNNKQVEAAYGVISRVLPEHSEQFILKLIEKDGDNDVFEIESTNKKIIIRGSSGVAICSGFNYYLSNYCDAFYNFRTGKNLDIEELPRNFTKIRKVTPYKHRYMLNHVTFSYSMLFWDWEQWEQLIDWMALNGINMPLAPMGQEIVWQRVYKKYGLSDAELEDFFPGPAYLGFGRMGCLDGYGGPLPQSYIEYENLLQKKILERQRQLGMTPVLQGFTGHIPEALVKKNPQLKVTKLKWIEFPETYLLDWQEPLFKEIGKEFISELTKEYGTDHFYAVDQFIEMIPENGDPEFLKSMSETVMSMLDEADPQSKWVLQGWPFNFKAQFWTKERTEAYLEGAVNDRMIVLELQGESWNATGFYKHEGWYNKPWVWSIVQNFGDKVDVFGGLSQIAENLNKALSHPEKGDIVGLGLLNEGLGYNPVIFKFVTDMIWENEVPDLNKWKVGFLTSRYGIYNDDIRNAWDLIFNYYYTKTGPFATNPILSRPHLLETDIIPSKPSVSSIDLLLKSQNTLKNNDAYQYDIVHFLKQVLGQYAGHLLFNITSSYQLKDVEEFNASVKEFTELAMKMEQLLATRDEFLFGKWIADSRERATSAEEERLYVWNAKAILTTWGNEYSRRINDYAKKDWAGMYSYYYLPRWEELFSAMRDEILTGKVLNMDNFNSEITKWEEDWVDSELEYENITSEPVGDPIAIANQIWNEYREEIVNMK